MDAHTPAAGSCSGARLCLVCMRSRFQTPTRPSDLSVERHVAARARSQGARHIRFTCEDMTERVTFGQKKKLGTAP
eukprot:673568-Prymnesium_polylepis.1